MDAANNVGDVAIFHRRTKSVMISKRIKSSITTSSWKSLMLHKDTSTTTGQKKIDNLTII